MQDGERAKLPVAGWMALAGILVAHAALRLVQLDQAIYDSYQPIDRGALSQPWRLFLPMEVPNAPGGDAYRWSTSGIVLTGILDLVLTPKKTFLLVSLACVASSFAAGWVAFRGTTLAVTLALCAAFGTQFDYAFVNSSCVVLPLLWIYAQWNLVALLKLSEGARPRLWRGVFVVSLLFVALAWEMWLDYAGFLILAVIAAWYARDRLGPASAMHLRFVTMTVTSIVGGYLVVKLGMGGSAEHMRHGQEAELIATYFDSLPAHKAAVIAAEDVISNHFTYTFLAWSNYLPPFLLGSTSLQALGTEGVVEQQFGYHREYGSLVAGHHVFFWYFAAGMVTLAFWWVFVRTARAAWRTGDRGSVIAALLLLMAATGASTHLVIKYRPYLSVPLLSYKCTFSVLAATIAIAFALDHVRGRVPAERWRWIAGASWTGIVVFGLLRPSWLSRLAPIVGLSPFPDPLAPLR